MAFAERARLFSTVTTAALCIAAFARTASAADTVVQIPVDAVLDGRSVSTLATPAIVPWSAGQGVDGDGYADGFVTTAVEAMLQTQGKTEGGKLGVALPDDGKFAANARHPEVQLHFSNAASSTSAQTHQLHINQGPQTFTFNVPQASYSKMFLFITCSEGAAALTITMNYVGGAAPKVTTLMLPDYGIGGAMANDPVFFNLIQGMDKWSTANQEGDGPSHTITGIELTPTSDVLASIQVTKTNASHAVFWGATGIATSTVSTGAGGSGGASGAAGTGASASGGNGNGNGGSSAATATGGAAGASTGGTAGTSASGQAGSSSTGTAGSSEMSSSSDGGSSSGCSFTSAHGPLGVNSSGWGALLAAAAFSVLLRRGARRARALHARS